MIGRIWIQNATSANVCFWQRHRGIAAHVYEKRHMPRFDTSRIEIGIPKANAAGTSEWLFGRGVFGLYGFRAVSEREKQQE